MSEVSYRKPSTPYIKSVRSMTKDDIEALRQPSSRVRLKKLRDSHHIIARLLVSGLSNREVAQETGYSETRISIIKSSPAMQELIARYRADDDTAWREKRDTFYDYVHSASAKAWRKINEVLDADDENAATEIPVDKLLKIASDGSDRVGYHKRSTKENINIDFAARLELAISRSARVITKD